MSQLNVLSVLLAQVFMNYSARANTTSSKTHFSLPASISRIKSTVLHLSNNLHRAIKHKVEPVPNIDVTSSVSSPVCVYAK